MLIPRTPKTTDAVLSVFRKALTDLEGVVEQHLTIADDKEAESIRAKSEADAARREARKAVEALGRLEAVFGAAS